LEGLAFLISEITAARPAAILLRMAPTKSRAGAWAAACSRTAASETTARAAATSSRFTARILLRMSDMGVLS
jgi:hypothetical protein